jgi:acyl transferase domain-containing protein/NADPH:quinone reductase-like Zn-dependent oxidoreductase/ubiquinone/menaquinone biosynthesis C-methylase UbiE/acyl carrier protein
LPGHANSPEAFWQLLCNGVDAIREIPPDRWDLGTFYDPTPGTPGKTYARWGGFIDSIDQFDAPFFGISPREAAAMDPQQRLLLEVAYEALEDGGQTLERLAGSNTGVFIGISTHDYGQIQSTYDDLTSIDTYTATGSVMSITANRISYCFDLRGPSLIVDTACSSALVALHLACHSLWQHESTLALAGGVNVIIGPENFIGFSRLSMLSPDGRCKAFDAHGNGFVRSEGVGVVALKPLAQALADGDPIYAVIRGTAVNQDGRTGGITVPNREAQIAMLHDAYQQAGIAPEHVQYVEAHGTGTAVGDPIETNALGAVLSARRREGSVCLIGSVKSNIGHLEAGAGIAGLIKTALALKHGLVPPNLHLREPNPLIDFAALQLRVPQRLEPWPDTAGHPRLAGVNAFGFGGTNAHIVLSEAPHSALAAPAPVGQVSASPSLLPLSARSPEALRALAQAYVAFLQEPSHAALSLQTLGYNLSRRRTHHDHRLALVVQSPQDLRAQLEAFVAGQTPPGLRTGHPVSGQTPKLAFVFTGQGAQWWAMGRQLLEHEPVFRDTIAQCDVFLRRYASWSLLEELRADATCSRLHETAIAQPALFALQAALAALWRAWGVEPEAVVGHSVGEVAAAYVAGVFNLETALRVIFHRGQCMERASSKGQMLGAGLAPDEAEALLCPYGDRVSLAAINSPSAVTLSGEAEALQDIAQTLEQRQVFCSMLRVEYAFHSAQMEPVHDDLVAALHGLRPQLAQKLIVSTVTAQPAAGPEFEAQYWWQNVRQSVRFGAAIAVLIDQGYRLFVEVGPHPVLTGYVAECLHAKGQAGMALPSLRRQEDERQQMLRSLGALYTAGCPIAWQAWYPQGGESLQLPHYPWQHASYWHEAERIREVRLGTTVHPLLGRRLPSAEPSWCAAVSRVGLPYLQDHQVQGHPVFPATGYIEMALAAVRETLGTGTYVVEELDLHKAFFLPESGAEPLLQTTWSAADASFSIYGRSHAAEPAWTLLASGKGRVEPSSQPGTPVDVDQMRQRYSEEVRQGLQYQRFQAQGLHYGPAFQGLTRLWWTPGEALGRVALPESLQAEAVASLFHPALLDACLQVLAATWSYTGTGICLPVHVAQVRCFGRPGPGVWSHARLVKASAKTREGDIRVYDEHGMLVMDIRGLKAQSIGTAQEDTVDHWLYTSQWHRKPRPSTRPQCRPADFLPTTAALEGPLQSEAHRLTVQLGWEARFHAIEPALDQLCVAYISNAFRTLGWAMHGVHQVTVASLAQALGVVPQYHRLLGRLLALLAEDGWLHPVSGGWVISRTPPVVEVEGTWQALLQRFPALMAELILTARCGQHLGEVLQGKVDPLSLLFLDGSFTTAEHFFQDAPSFAIPNALVARAMALALARLPEGRTVRLLEIGAGTGGLTSAVLPQLPAAQVEYVFTDISAFFLQRAASKFRDYPFVTYQVLDIEQDPTLQGFEAQGFDLILAANVLYATQDVRATLGHVQRLLASQGLLVLLEIAQPSRWVELVFGLFEGWWRFRDADLRPSSPSLSRRQWMSLLQEMGFAHPLAVSVGDDGQRGQRVVVVARGPVIETQTSASQPEDTGSPGLSDRGQRWLIMADQGGLGQQLAHWLQSRGIASTLVMAGAAYQHLDEDHVQVCPERGADFEQLWRDVVTAYAASWQGIVHCWSLDSPPPAATTLATLERAAVLGCQSVLHLIQAGASRPLSSVPPLWLITRGAQPVGQDLSSLAVAQSPLCGLGRVIINEHPELCCKMVDLSPYGAPAEIQTLGEELLHGDDEDEVALRGEARYVHRLVRASLSRVALHDKHAVPVPHTPIRLASRTPGMLESLTWQETPRCPPGDGEVEMQVAAAALNFRDVLKALGLYPTDIDASGLLGDECTGRIVAVGTGVEGLHVGDEVIAIAPGSFGTFVTTRAALTVRKPSCLDVHEAATIPIVFLTAYYALHHLGRISQGERVLIHAATGGVGLAAIQIAQHVGAEVFATAGSPEKRELLHALGVRHVMDSRSLAFAEAIRDLTGGQGVDIVLNSLAGEAIQQGLACLAPYGRFLEIGVRDIYQNRKLGLRAFKNSVSFCAINLARVIAERPQLVHTLLQEVLQLFETGHLHPLPHRVFPISEAVQAFRHVAQARHIGKVVLAVHEQQVWVEPHRDQDLAFPAEATYLITGGLGGFGLAVAQWLVDRGARHLVLMGRQGAASEEAQQAVARFENQGAGVVVARGDVAHEAEVAQVLQDIQRSLPPLRGIVHAAMVLDDGLLLQLDPERFSKVMAPKVNGAWNLHRLTLHTPLDFFVLFSSIATMLGSPGQGNYVAANAFLDTLAHYRRAQHLPALTINWGRLSDVGYVARHRQLSDHFDSLGFHGLTAKQAVDMLERLLVKQPVHVGVTTMAWRQWTQYVSSTLSPRFSLLLSPEALRQQGEADSVRLRDVVMAAPATERLSLLEAGLQEQVARVLGMASTALELERPLTAIGLDSLMSVELKSRLEQELRVSLPTVELLRDPSIRQLAQVLLRQLSGVEATARPAADAAIPSPEVGDKAPEVLLRELEQLSEQEVDTLLSGFDESDFERLLAGGDGGTPQVIESTEGKEA